MKEVLGILGSPRRLGNCELITKEIVRLAPEGVRLRMVRLPEKTILPCKACYRCLMGACPLVDDFGKIMQAIIDADAIIVAAPTYLFGANGSLQRFLDRGLQFWSRVEDLYGKPAVAVSVAGLDDGEGHSLLSVENFCRGIGLSIRDRAVVHAALPGESLLSEEGRDVAKRLAEALFAAEEPARRPYSCGVCGGTFIELRGGNTAYCLACGARGTVELSHEGVVLSMSPPPHPWHGKAARQEHHAWLMSMVERFRDRKDELKEVSAKYAGGEFL